MQVIKLDQNTPEWLEARKGKITGSKLKDIVVSRGNGKKIGFYKLIADRIALEDDTTDGMDRGHDLEAEAIEHLSNLVSKKIETDLGMWVSDENDNIAISPDGGAKNSKGVYTIGAEIKCLGSARHIQIVIENKIPAEFWAQVVQYFIVNLDLEKVYFASYDPRVTNRPLHVIEVKRAEVVDDIAYYKDYQTKTLQEVDTWVEKLAF